MGHCWHEKPEMHGGLSHHQRLFITVMFCRKSAADISAGCDFNAPVFVPDNKTKCPALKAFRFSKKNIFHHLY